MKKNQLSGVIFVFLSAVIFGFTPVLAAISYQGGNNGINMAFLRAFLPIPVLLLLWFFTARKSVPTRRQVGTGVILVPWSLVCFLQGDPVRGAGLLASYTVASILRSVLEPKLVGRQLGLDPLITLMALYEESINDGTALAMATITMTIAANIRYSYNCDNGFILAPRI